MRPKKRLSQFFLKSRSYLKKISDAVRVKGAVKLLEIGAGKGELTEVLVEKGLPITCVEIDRQLCGVLKEKFLNFESVKIICSDIRDVKEVLPNTIAVGNIPYHISFEVLQFLVKNRKNIKRAYLTLQKEFARKLSASPGQKDYGYLCCFMQIYANLKILFTIPKTCFRPVPKVDSATVEIDFCFENKLNLDNEEKFLEFLRKIFSQRRKKICNILSIFYSDRDIKSILNSCGVDRDLRPENIPVDDLASIYNHL
jgi:16S rRNA (adenine1518-N6/adenine1519-N6)-dimethyltransferase